VARHPSWAVVLAGGEGVRLRAFVRRAFGDERPKQFCRLLGSRSLLRQTLDRVARIVPPARTVVVGVAQHERYLAAELGGRPGPKLLKQPQSRGTAAAVLLATQWIMARDPRATVAFFPSEKPSPELARALFRHGALWNTLVFVAEAGALLATGRACVPGLASRLGWLSAFWDGDREEWAVRQAYALAPAANFSRAVLQACAQPVAVLRVPDRTWCDLGSPDRVLKTLARSGIEVPRLAEATAC